MSFDNDGAAPAAPATPERNNLALASLVVGIVSLVLCMFFVPAVVGLVLGLVALKQIKSSGASGRGMALAGAVTSAVSLVLGVIVVIAAAVSSGDKQPTTGATSTPPSASAPASAAPSPRPSATQSPTATAATPTTDPTPTPQAQSLTVDHVEAFLKESYGLFGGEPWTALCAQDPGFYPYPCAIASMELSHGVLRITVQESLSKDDAERYAQYALNFLCATESTAAEFTSVSWVEIADTSGGTRGQKMASRNPMCSSNR